MLCAARASRTDGSGTLANQVVAEQRSRADRWLAIRSPRLLTAGVRRTRPGEDFRGRIRSGANPWHVSLV
jgi:hypothetical protein